VGYDFRLVRLQVRIDMTSIAQWAHGQSPWSLRRNPALNVITEMSLYDGEVFKSSVSQPQSSTNLRWINHALYQISAHISLYQFL